MLFTERSAGGPGAVEKLEAYVRNGGKAIVTTGFLRKTYDRGILDLTSVRLTGRHARGREYMIDLCDYDYGDITYAKGADEVVFEALDYRTNATWADMLMLSGENNFPVLTEDFYGRGRFLVLNVPENFADLYRLPAEVVRVLCKELSTALPVYLSAEPKWSLIQYDNEIFCLHSFRPMLSHAQIVVRGKCRGLQDIRTGQVHKDGILLSGPKQRGDAAKTRTAPEKFAFDVAVSPGSSVYMQILR